MATTTCTSCNLSSCCCASSGTIQITSQIIDGTPEPTTSAGPQGDPGETGPQGRPYQYYSVTLDAPEADDEFVLLYTQAATTIDRIVLVMDGVMGGNSLTVEVSHAATATGEPTEFFTLPVTVSLPASGNIFPDTGAFVSDPLVIAANQFIRLKVVSVTGTVARLFAQITFTAECISC